MMGMGWTKYGDLRFPPKSDDLYLEYHTHQTNNHQIKWLLVPEFMDLSAFR